MDPSATRTYPNVSQEKFKGLMAQVTAAGGQWSRNVIEMDGVTITYQYAGTNLELCITKKSGLAHFASNDKIFGLIESHAGLSA